jgi:hypothetical protein
MVMLHMTDSSYAYRREHISYHNGLELSGGRVLGQPFPIPSERSQGLGGTTHVQQLNVKATLVRDCVVYGQNRFVGPSHQGLC